jgi:protein TonB
VPFSDLLDTVEITLDDAAPPLEEERAEPSLAGAPFFIEFEEPARLDPKRLGLTWEVPAPAATGMRWRSSLSALAVHVLPVLLILGWPTTTTEVPVIPVQLVIVQPPEATPPPEPQEETKPGRLSSEDSGEVKPQTAGAAPSQATPAAGEKQPDPTEAQPAAAAPSPAPPPPKPAPPKPVPRPPPKTSGAPVAHHEETPHEAPRAATVAGPTSTRDEYLAYLVTLTRQHIDLLPMSVIGSRSGETVVTVAVLDDGTITHISVARSSGYSDIDERIQQMVAAVGKFPPVPQWFQGKTLELELSLRFPEAIAHPNAR